MRLAAWLAFGLASSATAGALADGPRDLESDTWVATDSLGRSLPGSKDVGAPRKDKFVGVFYFLWLGQHGEEGPFDITKILAKDPTALQNPKSPLWAGEGYPHHWGESLFGYYVSDDEGVLRKHAQMLADADVDMIVFDVTNQVTYPKSWRALCKVFDQMKREGNRVPQIAFLTPFWDPKKVVNELWDDLYGPNLYPDLWFRWEGKPLILADPNLLGGGIELGRRKMPVELVPGHTLAQTFRVDQTFRAVSAAAPTWESRESAVTLTLYRRGVKREKVASKRFENLSDNDWVKLEHDKLLEAGDYELEMSDGKGKVGWWSDSRRGKAENSMALADGAETTGERTLKIDTSNERVDKIREFFTFRKPQPDYFVGPTGPEQWGWLEVYPQHAFYKTKGVPEEVAVGIGQNAAEGKLSVFTYPKAHGRSFHDGKEPGLEGRDTTGLNFAEQWKRALEIDPAFVFVTNWNEWIAGRFSPANMPLHGTGPVTFVDEFDQEFSRDIEPMLGGHGDNYYYQMIANIRRFKGARAVAPVTPRPVVVDGKFEDWREVGPEFRDTVGDPANRDHKGWGTTLRYVNKTGRNDIVSAKASFDDKHVSFYAKTHKPLTNSSDPNWMLLYVDTDQNPKTGWLGYDVVINRKVVDPSRTTVGRNIGNEYKWGSPVEIPFKAEGNELELSIPLEALGLAKLPATLDFKWADNVQQTGDWSDFTLNGDVAPNDRYNYRAQLQGQAP
ncbi:hypothetical protein [Singulisphaera sp. PoT]|uniref:hypothetical protein n=1 Tax=Singulisphaera sp. PoT TaxID=3411797 RepID=UPI003BF45E8B